MSELKPCPFCGGEAEIGDGRNHTWRIECVKCFSRVNDDVIRSKVILTWNTRPSPWIRVEDDLPKGIGVWLVIRKCDGKPESFRKNDDSLLWRGFVGTYTHWMPIPELPKG